MRGMVVREAHATGDATPRRVTRSGRLHSQYTANPAERCPAPQLSHRLVLGRAARRLSVVHVAHADISPVSALTAPTTARALNAFDWSPPQGRNIAMHHPCASALAAPACFSISTVRAGLGSRGTGSKCVPGSGLMRAYIPDC